MAISQEIKSLLEKHNVSEEVYVRLATAEEITPEEELDLEFIEDRLDCWKEFL